MSRRVSVDADLLGGLAACGTVGGAILGAKKGSHAGIVFGRKMGVKGTVVFGTIGALTDRKRVSCSPQRKVLGGTVTMVKSGKKA